MCDTEHLADAKGCSVETAKPRSVAIVGAGIAGLCAGIYAQKNGYASRIYEMSRVPGGLCTAWRRKGYIIDFCIHWLVGSAPPGSLHKLWQEVGLLEGREIIDLDEFARFEDKSGRTLVFFTDLARLEEHLIELSPADADLIKKVFRDTRRLCGRDMPSDLPPRELMSFSQQLTTLPAMMPFVRVMRAWDRVTCAELADRFADPLLAQAFRYVWMPESSTFFLLMTLAWLNDRVAGYPIGGSLPMARALEKRYLELGGEIEYESRVDRIMVEAHRAVGVRVAGGTERRADWVISAADGHSTIFDLLGGAYTDEEVEHLYDTHPLFPSVLFVSLGVNRDLSHEPRVISGCWVPLEEPLDVGGRTVDHLHYHVHNFDPTFAPEGKTLITSTTDADYEYWTDLSARPEEYEKAKQALAEGVIRALEARYPGIAREVEMVDVATPATIERYTGNWKGSMEGWLPVAGDMKKTPKKTLPGLSGLYMAGQWVVPGGGLPSGVMSAREVVQLICHEDVRTFTGE